MANQPFITIITRTCRRPKALERCKESVASQTSQDIQHLILKDPVGKGLLHANSMFYANRNEVLGRYVYMLDDDDVLTDENFVADLKNIHEQASPDVIFVRGRIDGNLYPRNLSWKQKPRRGEVGTPCFVVSNEVFQNHISNFAKDKAGDFSFISSIFEKESSYSMYWHTKEVFSAVIGHGKPECPIIIDIRTPYVEGKELGQAYNTAMETVSDWALFVDHDILQVNPHYFDAALNAIRTVGHRAGWITCMTNRIACPHQKDPTAPKGDDIMQHMAHSGKLWQQYGNRIRMISPEVAIKSLFSGFFILTHRQAWEDAGGFKNGFLGVDNDYHVRLIRKHYSSYVLPGVYCYHIYRQKLKWVWG